MDRNIIHFRTEMDSVYYKLEDGRTRRFKTATREAMNPQDIIVFVPDYETIARACPPESRKFIGQNDTQYEQMLLEYVQLEGKKTHVVDQSGNMIETNSQLEKISGKPFLALSSKNKIDFIIPVVKDPRTGFRPYDSRLYSQNGEIMREKHLGHKVTEINGRAVK